MSDQSERLPVPPSEAIQSFRRDVVTLREKPEGALTLAVEYWVLYPFFVEAIETMRRITQGAVTETQSARRQRERRRRWTQAPVDGSQTTSAAAASQTTLDPLPAHERLFTHVEEWS